MLPSLIKHSAQRIYLWPSVPHALLAFQCTKSSIGSIHSARYHTTYGPATSTFLPLTAESKAGQRTGDRVDHALDNVRDVDAAVELEQSLLGAELRREGRTKVTMLNSGPAMLDSSSAVMISNHTLMLHNKVLEALRNEQVHKLLRHFLEASADPAYFLVLPRTTAREILRSLDPSTFLDEIKAVHRDLGEDSEYISYPHDRFRHINDIFAAYGRLVNLLLWRWQQSGQKMGLEEYKILLNMARSTGNGETARASYLAMQKKGIQPDVTCYNYYFEARCWNNVYHPYEKYALRVEPKQLIRREGKRPWLRGYRAGEGGLRQEIIHAFHFMVNSGVRPDVHSYRHLITALGREGDMDGVKEVLKEVWNVDVDYLMISEDTESLFENDLPSTSLLYPDQDLLFTIAHVMGSNNRITYALRVVDVFSRKYGIEISSETWHQLFVWTCVVSSARSGKRNPGPNPDEVELPTVEKLWNTMVAEPYNIKPTMPMYNRYIKNMQRRQKLNDVLKLMREGRQLHMISKANLTSMLSEHENQDGGTDDKSPSDPTYSLLSQRARSLELRKLEEYRDHVMISRWVTLVLSQHKWISHGPKHLKWERIEAQSFIDEWWSYRPPTGFEFWTSTVKLHFRDTMRPIKVTVQRQHTSLPGIFAVISTNTFLASPDASLAPVSTSTSRGRRPKMIRVKNISD